MVLKPEAHEGYINWERAEAIRIQRYLGTDPVVLRADLLVLVLHGAGRAAVHVGGGEHDRAPDAGLVEMRDGVAGGESRVRSLGGTEHLGEHSTE